MKGVKLLILLMVFTLKSYAQSTFITNYSPDKYKADMQNWAVVQDKRGILFFGNNDGVMEYDGNTWRLLHTPSIVRSLAIDSAGTIFVGLRADFGYLQSDSIGRYKYKSIRDKIPKEDLEFNDIWEIHTSENKTFFQSGEKIFILQNNKIKTITPKTSFHRSFLLNNSLHVREKGIGLMIYKNDQLLLVEGGEQFANIGISAMLPYSINQTLIITSTKGLWLHSQDEKKFYQPNHFETVNKFLLQHPAYCGTQLNDGTIAIGTLTGGIIVFNHSGIIKTIYNTTTGLQDNIIYRLFFDRHQQLWACMGNGVSLVQTNIPFQIFTEKNGIKGSTLCIHNFKNKTYVGTTQYLSLQKENGDFQAIIGTEDQNRQLIETNGMLLLANISGLYEIKENQAFPHITNNGFLYLCPLANKPNNLLAGPLSGLCVLEFNQNKWKIKNKINGFTKVAHKIIQEKNGIIWTSNKEELYKFELNKTLDSVIHVIQCTVQHGLPSNNTTPYQLNSGEVVFGTKKGIYRYNPANLIFETHSDFHMVTGSIIAFDQQKNGDIWFQEKTEEGSYETGILKRSNGLYQLIKQPFYKFNEYRNTGYNTYFTQHDSAVLMGTEKGLLQYNPNQPSDYNKQFHTLIRNVIANDTLFGGTTFNPLDFENIKGKDIPFSKNNLVFRYAATYYEDIDKTRYSYRLIGSDTTWSAWVSDVKKEYTKLHEGTYSFEVRSKNQYKVIGRTASYSFRILPPWHRTWWAYTLYVIMLTGCTYAAIYLYSRHFVAQKEKLERIIQKRTYEIMEMNEELRQQRDQIHAQNRELNEHKENLENKIKERTIQLELAKNKAQESDRLKSSFLQNMSHEIRTPLNAIVGFSRLMTSPNETNENLELFSNMISESSDKLIEIVTDVIEISQIQSKTTKLKLSEFDIVSMFNTITNRFKNIALKKNIAFNIKKDFPFHEYAIESDHDKLQRIFVHLVDNAIKFTHQGKIETSLSLKSNEIIFSVSDTGIGISEEMQRIVFEPFRQVETDTTRVFGGNGIGLSITKAYIELMKGSISLQSEINNGTTIHVSIPINKSNVPNKKSPD